LVHAISTLPMQGVADAKTYQERTSLFRKDWLLRHGDPDNTAAALLGEGWAEEPASQSVAQRSFVVSLLMAHCNWLSHDGAPPTEPEPSVNPRS
jgi:hypothetical protein